MYSLRAKLKRQVEILGLVLAQPKHYKKADLAAMFDVEEITINRDLNELRSYGIDVHSWHSKGIAVFNSIGSKKLNEIILQYIGINYSEDGYDKSTALLVKQRKDDALSTVVLLQRCIDQSTKAITDYEKEPDFVDHNREIWPLLIFQSDGLWRVLAQNEGLTKQYLINKILNVRSTTKRFKKISSGDVQDLFKYSWRSWLGAERYNIKLKITEVWAEILRLRPMMEEQTILHHPNGDITFEVTVNNLDEVASWVVGRGKDFVVLEPEELKQKVVRLAKAALSVHG